MKKHHFVVLMGLISLSACTRTTPPSPPSPPLPRSDKEIRFSSSIATRAAGTTWEAGDAIGVYMEECQNIPYTTAGDGDFTAVDEPLYYPDAAVDFVAYYPYREDVTTTYTVDVAANPVDLLYSNNAQDCTDGVPQLHFEHRLSKLIFTVSASDDFSLNGMTAILEGLHTRGSFDLLTGEWTLPASIAPLVPSIRFDGETAITETLIIPQSGGYTLTFAFPDGKTSTVSMSNVVYLPGKCYTYRVNLSLPESHHAVVLGGGAGIDDWDTIVADDEIVLILEEDSPAPPQYGEPQTYFSETFSDAENSTWSDTYGNLTVQTYDSKGLDEHILFPKDTPSELLLTGLPADCTEITLCYRLATGTAGVAARELKVYAGTTDLSDRITSTTSAANTYITVSFPLPDATSSLRFVSSGVTTFRLDNIQITGRKPL